MTLKAIFGVAAVVLSLFALHTISHNWSLLKEKFSGRRLLRILSSIGIVLPIECVLLYIFVSYNGVGAINASTFFTQSLGMSESAILSVVAQQAFIVNALKLISSVTFGSAAVLMLDAGMQLFFSHKAKKKEKGETEENEYVSDACAYVHANQYTYLRFGGFLS